MKKEFVKKIHNKGAMSQLQIQVTIFLSGTDVSQAASSVVLASTAAGT